MRRDHDIMTTDLLIRDRKAEALYRAHQNMAGRWVPLAVRWVDTDPRPLPPRDLIDQVRVEREAVAREAVEARYQALLDATPPVDEDEADRQRRERHAINARNSWLRKRERMYGNKTAAELAAEREEKRRLTRTPEQQKRHDEYEARKARKNGVQ